MRLYPGIHQNNDKKMNFWALLPMSDDSFVEYIIRVHSANCFLQNRYSKKVLSREQVIDLLKRIVLVVREARIKRMRHQDIHRCHVCKFSDTECSCNRQLWGKYTIDIYKIPTWINQLPLVDKHVVYGAVKNGKLNTSYPLDDVMHMHWLSLSELLDLCSRKPAGHQRVWLQS
jgi:hypothetical protein